MILPDGKEFQLNVLPGVPHFMEIGNEPRYPIHAKSNIYAYYQKLFAPVVPEPTVPDPVINLPIH
jgi:hypothetical protein